jgi:hypothetical protein
LATQRYKPGTAKSANIFLDAKGELPLVEVTGAEFLQQLARDSHQCQQMMAQRDLDLDSEIRQGCQRLPEDGYPICLIIDK